MAHFHRSIIQRIYWIGAIKLTSEAVFTLLTRRRVIGRENVPQKGPLLVVSNHLSFADQFLIGVSLGRKLVFMAKMELFKSWLMRHMMHRFGAFPIRRGGILDRKALAQANQVLEDGQALVMFPEGRRNQKAAMTRAFPGSAVIALNNGIPILPVAITGMEYLDTKGLLWQLRHRPHVTVTIGLPFCLKPADGGTNKKEFLKLGDHIMGHVAELLPPEYRGYYGDQQGTDGDKD